MENIIKIEREQLINKCDEFLEGLISKDKIKTYASEIFINENVEWDDDIISEIIFQWDNEEINYPINISNIKLWKHRLKTEENLFK